MSKQEMTQVGRLALRSEGEWLNAYFAQKGTMEGAVLLGSIRMSVIRDERVKQAFIDTMRAALGAAINAAFGAEPLWGAPRSAPEHERAGRA